LTEQSVLETSLNCGRNIDADDNADALVMEAEYENVSYPVTQSAISPAAGRQLGKKPKPGPKPNIVAMRVAEFRLQQKLVSNGSVSPTKADKTSSQPAGPKPPRPPAVANSSKSTKIDLAAAANRSPGQFDRGSSSSDQRLYDTAVRVQLDVLRQVFLEDTAFADDDVHPGEMSSPTTPNMKSTAAPIYATPMKRVVRPSKEEPIYDEAIVVASAEDDDADPLYDEAVIVHSSRLPRMENNTTSHQVEPLYADPDDLPSPDRSDAASVATQHSDVQDADLYEEAQPVNRTAIIPCTH